MESFTVLTKALNYIELHLCEDIVQDDIAQHCSYSLSSLQKMFRRVFHIGISDYINRRKITSASKELLLSGKTILEIALKYGYNSHEVFSRAFIRIWGETPSQYRRKRSFSEIYPKLDMPVQFPVCIGGNIMEFKKMFDVTELYDYLKKMDGIYILSFDIEGLMPINDEYGHGGGDIVIAECLKRIDGEKQEDMLMFRIGGDEFILLTNSSDIEKARELGDSILKHNGQTVAYNGTEIPVSMRYGVMKLESRENLRYGDLFVKLVKAARADKT